MHPKTPIRRTHSPEFKARVMASCRQPGVFIAAVARAHGPNSNVVLKWLGGIGMKRSDQHVPAEAAPDAVPMQFLPINLSGTCPGHDTSTQDAHLDLNLGAVQIKLHCPRDAPHRLRHYCAHWTR